MPDARREVYPKENCHTQSFHLERIHPMQCGRRSSFQPRVEGLEERALLTAHMTATLSNGLLTIYGTDGPDHIVVRQQNYRISIDNLNINVIGHGSAASVSAASVSRIEIHGYAGDDWIQVGGSDLTGPNALVKPTVIWAGDGNDKVWGSQGNDVIYGGGGNDQIWGRGGNDRLYGGDGNDVIDGGSGTNYLSGDGGNDTLYSRGVHDSVNGGPGYDVAYFSGATPPRSLVSPAGSPVIGVEVFRQLPPSASAPAPNPFAADVTQLINLINNYRRSNGLNAVTVDPRLMSSATYQAHYMARTGDYSHVNLDGRTLVDRVEAAGYSFSFIAENIHLYDPAIRRTLGIDRTYSLDELPEYYFDGWRVSPGHNATMLSNVTNIGVAIASDSVGRLYVAADFGRP
jgi:uncharacterized protein YkwD